MDNTMKLLRAFIEASGYEIEVTEDIKRFYLAEDISISGDLKENATPESVFNSIDYKVTKKKPQVCFDVDSPEWSSVVLYIIGHRHEIQNKENDFGSLAPMLDSFDRSIKQNKSPD